MNIAICFSGIPRSIKYTCENIKNFINHSFKDYDVYGYITESSTSNDVFEVFNLKNSNYVVEKDSYIDDSQLVGRMPSKQGYLQQLYGMKKSFELLESSNKKYDLIMRCRFDILFDTPFYKFENLQKDILYIPNFHHFDGINDRFCLGSYDVVKHYFNIFDFAKNNTLRSHNAESLLAKHLSNNHVKIKFLPIYFSRVREPDRVMKEAKHPLHDRPHYPNNLIIS